MNTLLPVGIGIWSDAFGAQNDVKVVWSRSNDGTKKEASNLQEDQEQDHVGQLPGGHRLDDGTCGRHFVESASDSGKNHDTQRQEFEVYWANKRLFVNWASSFCFCTMNPIHPKPAQARKMGPRLGADRAERA